MASIIKIKRNSTQGQTPSSLEVGEIAVNLFDRKLFVGNTTGVTAIGGEDFRFTTSDPTAGAGAYLKLLGETVLSTNSVLLESGDGVSITRQSNGTITFAIDSGAITNPQLLNDHIEISGNTGTNIDVGLGQVFNVVSGDGTGVTTAVSANTITISGTDATTTSKGVASFATADFNVASGAVELKDTVVKTVSSDSGSATPSTHGLTISGTANEIETSGTGATITIGLPEDVTVAGQLNVSENIVTTGNGQFGGTLSVTGVATFSDDASVGGQLNVSENVVATGNGEFGGTLDVTGATTLSTLDTSGAVNINDTTSSTDTTTGALIVDGGVGVAENLNVGGDLRVTGDTVIDGNLNVEGALTYISTSTVQADDSMFKLAANNVADTVDTGIYAKYVTGVPADEYAGYFRDATDGVFKFYTGLGTEPTATVDTSDAGYTLAQVDAIIDGGTY